MPPGPARGADGGYAGKLLDWARNTLRMTIQIV
jgi:hypothetical protein